MVGAILEFMTTRHGHKPIYGWVIFVGAVGVIFGAIAAASVRARVQRNRQSAQTAVSCGELSAEINIDGQTPRKVQAQLREVGSALELTLVDSAKSSEAAEVIVFTSILEVEVYLKTNTLLRLGDLRTKST